MHTIEVNKVTKIYRKGFRAVRIPAVVDLSFSVRKGVITGFVGPNGAGKTTTIKMIAGLVHPTKGTIRLNGRDTSSPSARRGVAFLSEQPYFYAHLTVDEMLRFAADLLGVPSAQRDGETARVLETVELTHKRRMKIKDLSKGMQQRLNMAQALLGEPHTFILDEPMSGMDPPGRRLFREIMAGLRAEAKTLFFSTHVLDDVETVCDDVVVLDRGTLTYAGPVRTLLDDGFLGTEIAAAGLEQGARDALVSRGYSPQYNGDTGKWVLLIPKTDDPAAVLRLLHEHNVFPSSIVRRTMTLEALLYQRKPGGDA